MVLDKVLEPAARYPQFFRGLIHGEQGGHSPEPSNASRARSCGTVIGSRPANRPTARTLACCVGDRQWRRRSGCQLWPCFRSAPAPAGRVYALPGAAPVPHIYAHDAIVLALESGKKSMSELVEITGKNSAELWAAFRRRLFPSKIAKRAGFRSGHDVRPGFRGRVAVFALTDQGRRRARAGQTPNTHHRYNRSANAHASSIRFTAAP